MNTACVSIPLWRIKEVVSDGRFGDVYLCATGKEEHEPSGTHNLSFVIPLMFSTSCQAMRL